MKRGVAFIVSQAMRRFPSRLERRAFARVYYFTP